MTTQNPAESQQASRTSASGWWNVLVAALARLSSRCGAKSVAPATDPLSIRLRRDQVLPVTTKSCRRGIKVRSGIVWLTDTPGKADVLLRPGDSFRFTKRGPFVLEALEDAEIFLV